MDKAHCNTITTVQGPGKVHGTVSVLVNTLWQDTFMEEIFREFCSFHVCANFVGRDGTSNPRNFPPILVSTMATERWELVCDYISPVH